MLTGSDVLLIGVLLLFAAVCSGLNIAVMSLDLSELRRKAKLQDRRALKVLPLRENAHLTLAGILLINVAFMEGIAVVLGEDLNGFVAVAISSLLIVVLAELVPQALFACKALSVCATLSPFLRLMIFVTYPISKPLQKILDRLFGGPESSRLHTRQELGLMINEHLVGMNNSELDEDEVEIIRGALQLSKKQVSEIMTPLEHTYWLSPDYVINSQTIEEIKKTGYSRIPIFDKDFTQSYGILLVKELVNIDFDDKSYKVEDFKLHKTKLVGFRTALDTMFRKFIGAQTHLVPVEKNDRIVGIVTIEDLVEEIIGHEIIDESDHSANRT